MIPSHSSRRNRSITRGVVEALSRASEVKTVTTHKRMIAKERATRSRKLKDRAYRNREKAVMAIPAVNIWLTVIIPVSKSCVQPLSMQPFRTVTESNDQRTKQYPAFRNTNHYTRRTHNQVSAPGIPSG